jgi:hypothetical protein
MSNDEATKRSARRLLGRAPLPDWTFSTPRLRGPIRRPSPEGPSIRSAWLRFAGDRPKLAVAIASTRYG